MAELLDQVPLSIGAARSGMSVKTARKYRDGRLPSECRTAHTWRTREDPFAGVWDQIAAFLGKDCDLQAKTLFEYLQREHPGRFQDGQLRSLQRRLKVWRATRGPSLEVMFAQKHIAGDLGQSDFCRMTRLGVTVAGQLFNHLFYHFVLTHSNWETGSVCFSESFEGLSEGLQRALWTLGGVPVRHRTDSLTAAVTDLGNRSEFTQRYQALMSHYGLSAEHTKPRHPNENGDVEQSHHRFITRVDQELMLRGSREFATRGDYERFLEEILRRANQGRSDRFAAERAALHPLPAARLDAGKRLEARVGPGSTIRVLENVYSVPSRLIGERVKVSVGSEQIEVSYAGQVMELLPRLRGKGGNHIDYRHIIEWLVRKPGAFDQYIYRSALFPTSLFRAAYDALTLAHPAAGRKRYLELLHMAAREGQTRVEDAVRHQLAAAGTVDVAALGELLLSRESSAPARQVQVAPVDLRVYDNLLTQRREVIYV
jgi:hypothetical protein